MCERKKKYPSSIETGKIENYFFKKIEKLILIKILIGIKKIFIYCFFTPINI